ncbi:MAG: right-handed parallel beta-helix repeat-containing protein, partial [Ginsengibacter sp.]
FVFDIKSDIPSNIVIADIGFRSKKPSVVEGDGGSTAESIGISVIQCVDFVIERCRFEYFAEAGINVIHKDDLARGLIRKNEFYYNAGAGLGYGIEIYGTNKQWVTDPKFGTSNFIFIEDNIFDFHRHSVAAGSCGLYVFRYNTVLNNIAASGGHAIDTHEARPGEGSAYGTRAVEVYNNKLLNTTYDDSSNIINGVKTLPSGASLETAGIAIRNGEAVVFNNEVIGYYYATSMSNWYLRHTVQPYPVPYSPGYLSGLALGPNHSGINSPEGDGDAFFWNNTNTPFISEGNDSASVFHNFQPDWWKEGRDYHFVPKPGYKPYLYPYPVKRK